MNPKRQDWLFGALFLGVIAVVAALFAFYPTDQIPPESPAHTIGKVFAAVCGLACVIVGVGGMTSR